jgi:acyl-CoA thioester hydrolase
VNRFTIAVDVVPADIDDNDHVNNVVYLRWVNDVAVAHWLARSDEAMRATWAWVAVRHELDYRREARLGDHIVVETWVGQVDSRRFERLTRIVRAADGAELASARTLWCLTRRDTGKLARIPAEMMAAFSVGEGAATAPPAA